MCDEARFTALELAFDQLRAEVRGVIELEESLLGDIQDAVAHDHQELTDEYAGDTARKVLAHLARAFQASKNDNLRAVGDELLADHG